MPNGKLVTASATSDVWRPYIGLNQNNTVPLANYSDITYIQNQISSISGYKYFYHTQYITSAGADTWTYMTTLPEFSWGILITYWGKSYTSIRISADTSKSAYNCPSNVQSMYAKPTLRYNMSNGYSADNSSISVNNRAIYYAAANDSDINDVNDTYYICFSYFA